MSGKFRIFAKYLRYGSGRGAGINKYTENGQWFTEKYTENGNGFGEKAEKFGEKWTFVCGCKVRYKE